MLVHLQVGSNKPFALDGSISSDPADVPAPMLYEWSCYMPVYPERVYNATNLTAGPCLNYDLDPLVMPPQGVVNYRPGFMLATPGDEDGIPHVITLVVRKFAFINGNVDVRNATTIITLFVVPGQVRSHGLQLLLLLLLLLAAADSSSKPGCGMHVAGAVVLYTCLELSHGLQLQPLWRTPTAAVSLHVFCRITQPPEVLISALKYPKVNPSDRLKLTATLTSDTDGCDLSCFESVRWYVTWLTAAIPMDSPCCSCKLTSVFGRAAGTSRRAAWTSGTLRFPPPAATPQTWWSWPTPSCRARPTSSG